MHAIYNKQGEKVKRVNFDRRLIIREMKADRGGQGGASAEPGSVFVTRPESESAGREHTISFDARDLPSGMYICRMTANKFTASRKMMLIR